MKHTLTKLWGILLLAGLCPLLMGTSWMSPDPRRVDRAWLLRKSEGLLEAFKPQELDLRLRAFYIDISYERSPYQQTLALGGWVKYRTRWWNHLSIGLTPYVVVPFGYDDPDRGGGEVLPPDQTGFAVLGEAYVQGRWGNTLARAFRQELHNPFINPYDFRMVPVTYEAITVINKDLPYTKLTASHVTGVKGWTDTTFQSMSQAAGFAGTDEPLTLAGAVFTPHKRYTLQLWDYFSHQFMNTLYLQADATWSLGGLSLTPSLQFIQQRDVGRALGGSFITYALGGQVALGWRGVTLYLAYTAVDDAHPTLQPWANYPSFTSMIELNNNQAGMDTWMLALDWDLGRVGLQGLNLSGYYSDARSPDSGRFASPDQRELDLILRYRLPGELKDFHLTVKYAEVNQQQILDGQDYRDIRLILNWEHALLK